jgi:hypothetical protein
MNDKKANLLLKCLTTQQKQDQKRKVPIDTISFTK